MLVLPFVLAIAVARTKAMLGSGEKVECEVSMAEHEEPNGIHGRWRNLIANLWQSMRSPT